MLALKGKWALLKGTLSYNQFDKEESLDLFTFEVLDKEDEVRALKDGQKLIEAQRLEQRTDYDIEMIREIGFCKGIENYSRYFDGREVGEPPFTLLDYFPDDFIVFIDESHMTIPQIGAMYNGDRSRKTSLVDYGFRLSSAFDNRPLTFEEFDERVGQMICVSATPAKYELEQAGQVVEQLIRPTGLIDPEIVVRPTKNQIDDLLVEINKTTAEKGRVLITTLTKKMASNSMSSAFTIYNDKQMSSQYSEYTKRVEDWEEKIKDMEDSYYKKFAAMEKALSKLQSQQSSLGGLLGGQ